MNWEGTIIYGPDSSRKMFSSRDGSWNDAPSRDVQIIVYPDSKMVVATASAKDYYILRNGEPLGIDLYGLFDWAEQNGVKFGRQITRSEFAELRRMVTEQFKEKRNWYPNEAIEPSS